MALVDLNIRGIVVHLKDNKIIDSIICIFVWFLFLKNLPKLKRNF